MLGLVFQKLWHKKWMNLSLILGLMLLVATLVSFPLYEKAAYNRMLQDQFETYMAKEGSWPTMNTLMTASRKDKKGKTIKKMEKYVNKLDETLGVNNALIAKYYYLTSSSMTSEMMRPDLSDKNIRLATLSDVEKHMNITYGEGFSESGFTPDGAVEVMVHESCLLDKGLLLGETVTLDTIFDASDKPVRIYIKGVFNTDQNSDFYWQLDSTEIRSIAIARDDVFKDIFLGEKIGRYNITCTYYQLFSYQDIAYEQVPELFKTTEYLIKKSGYRNVFSKPAYLSLLEDYLNKQTRIAGTLSVLQVPVLVMLAAFLVMISSQMYEMEKNEIAVIKSRGSYRRQIFMLYLYQNLILTIIGGGLGIVLGRGFASVLGATRNFMSFSGNSTLPIQFDSGCLIYAGAGCLFGLLCLTLPSIPHSATSIVKLKASRAERKKPLWQKLFIDIILIGVSLYGYYSFSKDLSAISNAVLSGESLDPLLYISSSLFILGMGLLYLRLQPWIVQLIYVIGKKIWGPAQYISFMENRKNGRKQQTIMLFLIMTISLGMYHSVVARTILDNSLDNSTYLDAADIRLQEKWQQIYDQDGMGTGRYNEPDFKKYMTASFADSATRVYFDDKAYLDTGDTDKPIVTVMGIHTKEFGSMTTLDDTYNEKSYYTYLNELAVDPKGLIVSSNLKTKYGYEIGDSVYFRSSTGLQASGKIVDFVDYWPGYATNYITQDADGKAHTAEGYLIVSHFETLRESWNGVPYEVWMTMKEGYEPSDVVKFIEDNKIIVRKYNNSIINTQNVLEDPLLQGTNGILTMGFVVTLILCVVGYLIYWIMSVKERELVFGVLRAGGLHKSEITSILMSEQLFCGLFSVVAGALIGTMTSELFIPVIQYAYASKSQTLPLHMVISTTDMIRLYGVVTLSMILCLIVLIVILQRMNIAKALKLGEE